MGIYSSIVKSSHQVYLLEPNTRDPLSWGTGCVLRYMERTFFCSVAHVTNAEGAVCIMVNPRHEDLMSKLYSVGGMWHFSRVGPQGVIPLDISFIEIPDNVEVVQPQVDLPEVGIRVPQGHKETLNLHLAGDPIRGKRYGFYGMTKGEYLSASHKAQPTLKYGLQYQETIGAYHLFRAPEVILEPDDYRGCSGAPILEETGKLVALLSTFNPGSPAVFGFSITECKRLIDETLL